MLRFAGKGRQNGKMKLSESPIITFIRGTTLLAVLIALPGIAVCWNHLPKDLWNASTSSPPVPKSEKRQIIPKATDESATLVSAFAPESLYSVSAAEAPVLPKIQTDFREKNVPVPNPWGLQNTAIQQTSWEPPNTSMPQDFESLRLHLQMLGATYYKLEKWGDRGELFRFSCLVSPTEGHPYEKHFQSFGSDAVTVMQTVVADIEKWKRVR